MVNEWISQLENQCKKLGGKHLHLIIDQSGLKYSVIPVCKVLSIEWQSLFQGLPEEIAESEAPLLLRIDLDDSQQRQWLDEICMEDSNRNVLLALCSIWPIDLLAKWLQNCADGRHEGRPGILRFYDPRLFPLLTADLLNEEQKSQIHRPVVFWSWIDRDGVAQLIAGNGAAPLSGEKMSHIDLSDRQLDYLMCVCDVNIMLNYQQSVIPEHLSQETLFQICYKAMCEASDKDLIMDEDRERWVEGKLAEVIVG
ncbi:DUF4123 domain-containing protein [Candidatus Pantoea floridensis]|uniref:DUF4123 domain-containing protein n=1 Tax=Candidatus Pantoea floridensis TaxID=1938870 RepID=A0A286BYE2_9GAMM|nr:DUF4123 domain-containing protein [Pantoea floridensis]PIF21653.1 uncharacterized protein DUF4123 [Enterobacteriaceae bacterium JKS000233]SOD39164.1 protein of unknown function [Pantoea floridensis]